MNNPHYKLYYAPDNASLVIRLALAELQLPYEIQLVNRKEQEQKSPHYLNQVPTGLIPALQTDQGIIFETAAILIWLADKHQIQVIQIRLKAVRLEYSGSACIR